MTKAIFSVTRNYTIKINHGNPFVDEAGTDEEIIDYLAEQKFRPDLPIIAEGGVEILEDKIEPIEW